MEGGELQEEGQAEIRLLKMVLPLRSKKEGQRSHTCCNGDDFEVEDGRVSHEQNS